MMLAPVLVTPPSLRPLTIEMLRQHCRVDHTEDDTLLLAFLDAATSLLDGYEGTIGRCLLTQVWRFDFDAFPAYTALRLPLGPVASVVVTYYDAAGSLQTLSSAEYGLFNDSLGAFVGLFDGKSWPTTATRRDAVKVTATIGAASANDVPQAIKSAILLMVGDLYANRETVAPGQVSEVPMSTSVRSLLAPFRRVSI